MEHVRIDPLLGTVIDGRYAINARIARGGMAVVYRATDTRLERDVAVKVIHDHLAQQPDFERRFIAEARASAKLNSENIVAVYDQGVADHRPYLVMELMPGPDLRTELSNAGSLPIGLALNLIGQVLSGLAVAHEAGIIHRDIKPENVLLTGPLNTAAVGENHVRAKVSDFGLARVATDTTHTNTMMGTFGYMAPEQATEGKTGKTADVYAVGIMLYELIAGKQPFVADTPIGVAYKHVNETMPRLSDQADWIPPALDSLIALLTAKDPAKRPQTGGAAKDALDDVAASIPEHLLFRRIPVFPLEAPKVAKTEVDNSAAGEPADTEFADTADDSAEPTEVLVPSSGSLPSADTSRTSVPEPVQTELAPSRSDTLTSVPTRRRRKRWPVLLIFLLLAIAGGGYGTWWYFNEGPGLRVPVPDVVALSEADATEKISALGFTVERTESFSDDVEAGFVISVDPEAGTGLHPSKPVTIDVSKGVEQVQVPNVVGAAQDGALEQMRQARLAPSVTEEYSEEVEQGLVISQSLEAGTAVPHDSAVELVVSLGRKPIPVPNLSGKTADEASAQLKELGLGVEVSEEFSESVEKGRVISQDPAAGEQRYRSDVVSLVVSKGPPLVEVPNVFGKQVDEATKILKDAGFAVEEDRFLGGYFGTVRSQSPGAGEKVEPGSTIKITIV